MNNLTNKRIAKFAAEPTITSTYAGEFAGQYIAAALLSANTLDKKLVTIMPNVKYKEVIQKVAQSGIVQDASCDFQTSGSVTLTEQIIVPKELQVNLTLCKENFVKSWEALQLGYSAFDTIPKNFNDYLIGQVLAQVAASTETSIWQGPAVGAPTLEVSTNGNFIGFQARLSGSIAAGGASAVLPALTGSAIDSGSITSANVINKIGNVYNTIPNTVYGKEDLVIYVSTNVAKAYQTALGGNANQSGFNTQMNVGEKPFNFQGIEIVMCPGMSDNKMVAAQKSNLFFGTGLLSDYQEVKVLDMSDIDGSQNFRLVARYTAGTQIGIGQDIVYYGAY
jgi:hypothetical protein